jgi:TonB family protein
VRKAIFVYLVVGLAGSCLGQTLCPKHIETPIYPVLARIAAIEGTVTLEVTIGADGRVKNAVVTDKPGQQAQQVLQQSAIDNIRQWTFEKPVSAPFKQVMIYSYATDISLHPDERKNQVTKVNIDLPDRVTILAGATVINTGELRNGKPKSRMR